MPDVKIHEFWYGIGYYTKKGMVLDPKILPASYLYDGKEYRLRMGVYILPGPMVVQTTRMVTQHGERTFPCTPPQRICSVAFNPAPGDGAWQEYLKGDFECRLVPLHRPTRFRRREVV